MTTVRHARTPVAPDEIVAQLRAAGHSVGRTRTAVVEALRRRNEAFTADELAADVPDVHVSTVYRTLGLLEQIGAVRHVAVPRSTFASLSKRLERDHDFVLDGSHFAIVGRCRTCAAG